MLLKPIVYPRHLFTCLPQKCFVSTCVPPQKSHLSISERHLVFLGLLSWKFVHIDSAKTKRLSSLFQPQNPAKVSGFQNVWGLRKDSEHLSGEDVIALVYFILKGRYLILKDTPTLPLF